ncbi:MAG: uracil-DNA glycosylase [Acidobacteria bacterium]|nr:uracil-DNA glycosylase [Acidobacteriota bacterium]
MRDLAELPHCEACALSRTRTRVVIGSGPRLPGLLVVGEAPGRHEDEGGEPFVGRSGQLLVRLIRDELGLERSQYFITNVVKCRPPQNRTPRAAEVTACRPWLAAQMERLAPTMVLAVGNVAAKAVFGYTQGIAHTHGRVARCDEVPGVATYHPAAALRGGPNVVDVMRADLRVLRTLGG